MTDGMRSTAGEQEAWIADRLGVVVPFSRDECALFSLTKKKEIFLMPWDRECVIGLK